MLKENKNEIDTNKEYSFFETCEILLTNPLYKVECISEGYEGITLQDYDGVIVDKHKSNILITKVSMDLKFKVITNNKLKKFYFEDIFKFASNYSKVCPIDVYDDVTEESIVFEPLKDWLAKEDYSDKIETMFHAEWYVEGEYDE